MNILLVVPHRTLFRPEGHLHRFTSLLATLEEETLSYLLPEGIDPIPELQEAEAVHYFVEPALLGRPVPYYLHRSSSFTEALKNVLATHAIDLVVFDFPWGLPAIEKIAPNTPAVYFSHGVEKDFAAITLKHLRLQWFPWTWLLPALLGRIERQTCALARTIVCMNKKDADRFTELYSVAAKKLYVLPQLPGITVSDVVATQVAKEAVRERYALPLHASLVVFHGSYSHFPNREACECIQQQIAPAFAEKSDVHFVVAGTGQPEFSESNVTSLGFVEDLDELLLACDIALVPVFSACGMQMKLFDYFRCGVPVVATGSIAASLDGSESCVIGGGDAPATLIKALQQALEAPALRAVVRKKAQEFIKDAVVASQIRAEFMERLASL